MATEVETIDVESEPIAGESHGTDLALFGDKARSIIEAANQIDEVAKAHEKLLTVIIQRTYASDWTGFQNQKGETHFELGSAGAERIALLCGITWEYDTSQPEKEEGVDANGPWVRYTMTGSVTFRNRKLPVTAVVSSRQKFYGFANGEWKEVANVSERDMMIAVRREISKEGIRQIFGLRKMPAARMAQLGYKMPEGIGFKGKAQPAGQAQQQPAPTGGAAPRKPTPKPAPAAAQAGAEPAAAPSGAEALTPDAAFRLGDGEHCRIYGRVLFDVDETNYGGKPGYVFKLKTESDALRVSCFGSIPEGLAKGRDVFVTVTRKDSGDKSYFNGSEVEVLQ